MASMLALSFRRRQLLGSALGAQTNVCLWRRTDECLMRNLSRSRKRKQHGYGNALLRLFQQLSTHSAVLPMFTEDGRKRFQDKRR